MNADKLVTWTILFGKAIIDRGRLWDKELKEMWGRTFGPPELEDFNEWNDKLWEELLKFVDVELDEDNDRILSWSDSAPVSAESVLLRYEEIRAQFRSALNAAMLRVLELEEDGPMLRALQAIDRYDFMPHHSKAWGYCDSPVPITYNMTESALHAVIMTLNAVLPQKGSGCWSAVPRAATSWPWLGSLWVPRAWL